MKVLTSSSSSINPGVYRCRDDCERPSLPRRSSTFRPESWPKAKAKVAPIAVTYPARPAADRHRITMYVGSVFDRRLEAVSASSHRRQRTRSVWRPCAAKAICDAPFWSVSVDATIHERVCSHRAVLLDDQPIGVNSHPARALWCVCSGDGRWERTHGQLSTAANLR